MSEKNQIKNEKKNHFSLKMVMRAVFFPIVLLRIIFRTIKEKMEYSIRLKLSVRYIKILLAAILAVGLGIIIIFGALKIQEGIFQDYSGIADAIDKGSIEIEAVKKYSEERSIPIQIYDSNNKLIFSSEENLLETFNNNEIMPVWTKERIFVPIKRDLINSGMPVAIVIFSDIKGELLDVYTLAIIMIPLFAAILVFAIWAVVLSGRGIFQPIGEMTQTVRDISERNLNLRLNVSGSKDELKELALTFNEMMNRIEDQYNKQKQFVSDASHELRTPIAVIQGYAAMLDRWGKNDQEVLRESIDAIKNESKNMNELIDKLLFLARHDNNTFVFKKEEFSLTEMLQEMDKETHIIDDSHRINFELRKEVSIYADRNLLKQAIRIFIDNAIKYTPQGGEIAVRLDRTDNKTEISIKDEGIGMTKEELAHIFDRFYRSDQSRTKERGGHGLGLAIAKTIILGHQGKINVKSRFGSGSEFIILFED